MCELLGMSANVPTDICFSFTGLIRRSGDTGPHKDGWGITFYEGKGARTFRDPAPGVKSPIAELVKNYPIKSKIVISHIRRATHGKVCLENTHPFSRELWGLHWTFAHNGKLKGVKNLPLKFYKPIGTTDSEHAFCWILDHIRTQFPQKPDSMAGVLRLVKELSDELDHRGIFNMLLSDGKLLYAYCSNNLYWITRRSPFGKAHLVDAEVQVDFCKVTSSKDVVTVIATKPLTTDEQWSSMAKGDLKVFRDGISILK